MASYLTQPAVAKIEPFRPNWDFLLKVADASQRRYDQNLARLEGLYGTLLNSPLTHDSNIERRDAFFKQSQAMIDHLASTDLSMPNIMEQAGNVFDPIVNDQYIQRDMNWTSAFRSQLTTAEGYRNSSDDKEKSKYWGIGMQDLAIQREKFKNSALDQTLTLGSPRYTPRVDIHDRALQIVKAEYGDDAGIELDQVTNKWIITTKNGPLVYDQNRLLIQRQLANDPGIQDMYRVMYNVGEYNFIKENLAAYGSEDAAALAFAEKTLSENEEAVVRDFAGNVIQRQSLRDEVDGHTEVIRKDGIVPGSKEHEEFLRKVRILAGLENDPDGEQTMQSLQTPAEDAAQMKDKAFRAFFNANLSEQSNVEARLASMKGYKRTFDENPYGMEAVKQANRVALENLQQRNKMEFEYFKSTLPGADGSSSGTGGSFWGGVLGTDGVVVDQEAPGGIATTSMQGGRMNGETLGAFRGQVVNQMAQFLESYSLQLGKPGIETPNGIIASRDLRSLMNTPEGQQMIIDAYVKASNNVDSNPVLKRNARLNGMIANISNQSHMYNQVKREANAADINIYNSWLSQEGVASELSDGVASSYFVDRSTGRPVSLQEYTAAYAKLKGKSVEDAADDAKDEYDEIMESYSEFYNRNSTYSARTKLFGGQDGMGAGMMSTPGYRTTVNGQVPNQAAAQMMQELSRTLKSATQNGGVVTYQSGDLGVIGSNDAQMKKVWDRIVTDLVARQGKDASGAPIFSLQYQSVAGGDGQRAGYTVTLDSEYAKKWIGNPDEGALIDEASEFAKNLTFSIAFDKDFDQSSYRYSNQPVDGTEASMRSNQMGAYYESGAFGSYLHMRELMDGSIQVTQAMPAYDPKTGSYTTVVGNPQVLNLSSGQYDQVRQQWYNNAFQQSQLVEQSIKQYKDANGAVKEPSMLTQ